MKIIKCDMCQDYYKKSDFEIMDEYANCCKHCFKYSQEAVRMNLRRITAEKPIERLIKRRKSKNFPTALHFPFSDELIGYAESDEHYKKRILENIKKKRK